MDQELPNHAENHFLSLGKAYSFCCASVSICSLNFETLFRKPQLRTITIRLEQNDYSSQFITICKNGILNIQIFCLLIVLPKPLDSCYPCFLPPSWRCYPLVVSIIQTRPLRVVKAFTTPWYAGCVVKLANQRSPDPYPVKTPGIHEFYSPFSFAFLSS